MVVRILFEQGYRVLEASNGEEALRVVKSHVGENIHLPLTDLVMPQMGGKDLAEQLKTLRPNTKVLLTSGYSNDLVFQNGELGGNVSFIQKPFMPADLVAKVQEVLGARLFSGRPETPRQYVAGAFPDFLAGLVPR
jgi:response regulator RpfG family c-di-GMP phosphodiesterase